MFDPAPVTVTPIEGQPAFLMTWPHIVDKESIRSAFRDIMDGLDTTDKPLYVVVDLRNNPDFPMTETIQGAYWGPFRHYRLAEWLVVSTNVLGRMIGHTLATITRRNNIKWFETMEEAMLYLQEHGTMLVD